MPEKKDTIKAYKFLNKAINLGVTHFEEQDKYFKANYDVLKPIFAEIRKPPVEFTGQKEIENLHDAYLNELKENFSSKLEKDKMYYRQAGFITDQQIWMVGVLCKYMIRKVMHFSHDDFMTAFQVDLGPILGEIGIWTLKNYEERMHSKGKADKKKKARCAIELISEFLENGWENLGKLTKYNIKNKFGPKKLPDQIVTRESIKNIYSWTHYAPLAYFKYIFKNDSMTSQIQKTGSMLNYPVCSYCFSPESETIKHKRCSACK